MAGRTQAAWQKDLSLHALNDFLPRIAATYSLFILKILKGLSSSSSALPWQFFKMLIIVNFLALIILVEFSISLKLSIELLPNDTEENDRRPLVIYCPQRSKFYSTWRKSISKGVKSTAGREQGAHTSGSSSLYCFGSPKCHQIGLLRGWMKTVLKKIPEGYLTDFQMWSHS